MLRQGDDHLLFLDQVLNVRFVLGMANLGAPRVAVFLLDLLQVGLDDAVYERRISQHFLEIGNLLAQRVVFLLQPVAFQPGQALQAHIQDRLRL